MRFEPTFSHAFLILAGVLACFFWRPIFLGEVIFPHENDRELAIPVDPDPNRISNRKFSDQSSYYIPELHHQLNGDAASWISTWNPHVELGRPTTHVSAISKAFWLTHVLSFVSHDPLRVYTVLVVFALSAASVFALLLFRAEGLSPVASLVGALGIGLGVFVTYWATFALFVFGIAWTLAWLWLLRVLWERWTPLSALGVVLVVQALLLTGYPQQIVWSLWFVSVYVLHMAARSEGGIRAHWRTFAGLAGLSLVGALAAAPVYLDVAIDTLRSNRLDVPLEFFRSALPRGETLSDVLNQIVQILDASALGNPIDPNRDVPFYGISLTPLFVFGIAASFLDQGVRRLWPVQAFVAVALLATFSPPVYFVGVEYLGLSLSRFIPLAGAMIPLAILAAHGFDAVLDRKSGVLPVAIGVSSGLAVLVGSLHAFSDTSLTDGGWVWTVLFVLAVLVLAARPGPVALVSIGVASVFVYAHPLLLVRPESAIHRDSLLAERLRELTADGSRYAWVDVPGIPSNQESMLALRSIHSYNSLSSRNYQDWAARISERGTKTHGRHFSAVRGQRNMTASALERAGVGLLVSRTRLEPAVATPIAQWGPLWFHRPTRPPLDAVWTDSWRIGDSGGVKLEADLVSNSVRVDRIEESDDRWRFDLEGRRVEGLLWVSSQFHPHWRARSQGRALETVRVDGIYLGVRLPAGTTSVELRFEPYVRWAWIPQVAWIVVAVACAGAAYKKKSRGER